MTSQTVLALLSTVFLVLVFIVSMLLLRRSQLPQSSRQVADGKRALSAQEERDLARRLARQAQRMERERQAEAAREAAEIAKPSLYQEKLRKREEDRLERERQEAMENQKRLRELDQWKSAMTVQDEGVEQPVRDIGSVHEFISYIEERKVVDIETIAETFRLSVDQVIKRIEDLESQRILYGVLDDRGRYIRITQGEVQDIKEFIERSSSREAVSTICREIGNILSASNRYETS